MKYDVQISNLVKKAIKKRLISYEQLLRIVDDFLYWLEGKDINLDVKKLSGEWQGFYRIRYGNFRIVLIPRYEEEIIYVQQVAERGKAYKK